MAKKAWTKFPYPDKTYDYAGASLKKAWPDLHRGDCEPFPDETWVKSVVAAHPKLDPKMPPAKAAEALQAAWRAYHSGDFAEAVEQGAALGPLGVAQVGAGAGVGPIAIPMRSGRRLGDLAPRAEALVGGQAGHRRGVALQATRLPHHVAVEVEPQRLQVGDLRVGHRRRRGHPLLVEVFDAQQHLAPRAAGGQPGHQGGAQVAQVQRRRGRGSEPAGHAVDCCVLAGQPGPPPKGARQ